MARYMTDSGEIVSGATPDEVVSAVKGLSPMTHGLTLQVYVKSTMARLRGAGAPIEGVASTPEALFGWWLRQGTLELLMPEGPKAVSGFGAAFGPLGGTKGLKTWEVHASGAASALARMRDAFLGFNRIRVISSRASGGAMIWRVRAEPWDMNNLVGRLRSMGLRVDPRPV